MKHGTYGVNKTLDTNINNLVGALFYNALVAYYQTFIGDDNLAMATPGRYRITPLRRMRKFIREDLQFFAPSFLALFVQVGNRAFYNIILC